MNDRLPFQVTFRGSDPYEARIHTALRLLPRGYSKLVFLRMLRRLIPQNASVAEIRMRLEEVVAAPTFDFDGACREPDTEPPKQGQARDSLAL
jgi:hypothetical protein